MSYKLKIILAGALILSLNACAYSVERLVKDDGMRHKLLKDCAAMGLKAKDEVNCRNALEAQTQVAGDKIKSFMK